MHHLLNFPQRFLPTFFSLVSDLGRGEFVYVCLDTVCLEFARKEFFLRSINISEARPHLTPLHNVCMT